MPAEIRKMETETKKDGLRLDWGLITFGGVFLFIALSAIYFFLGTPNADESWYLVASRLVYQGKILYRDFAYTQTPLLPYIFGLPQATLHPSFALGRATSVAFSIASLFLCIHLARRFGGDKAAGLTALLLATFRFGIYFQTIVKTYTLLSFLFALTFLVLSGNLDGRIKYPLGLLLVFLAAMVRLSAGLFFLPVAIFCLVMTIRLKNKSPFFITLAVGLALLSAAAWFFLVNRGTVQWDLIGNHMADWGSHSVLQILKIILVQRTLSFFLYYWYYLVILAVALLLILFDRNLRARAWSFIRQNPAIPVVGFGSALFGISHFMNGDWFKEYFVPAWGTAMPILGILADRLMEQGKSFFARILLPAAMVIAMLIAFVFPGIENPDLAGRQTPLEEEQAVSTVIQKYSSPGDEVMALEGLWTTIDSGHPLMEGLSMAQFSYQDMPTAQAERLHLVNNEILIQDINTCAAKIVVLTDYDWTLLYHGGVDAAAQQALAGHYMQVATFVLSGQMNENLYIYVCNAKE